MALKCAGNDTDGSGQRGNASATIQSQCRQGALESGCDLQRAHLQRFGGVEPRSELLYPSIQGADDWIEWTLAFAFNRCGEELR